MSTRAAWTYVGISILLLVGYFYTGTLEEKERVASFEARKIFDFEPEAIVRLSLDIREQDRFEAIRVEGAQWKMSAPYEHVEPNHPVWEILAKVVTVLTNEMVIEESPKDLSVYGLDDAPLKVEIETDANTLIQLNVGNLDPTQNNRYAQRIGEDAVFLLPANYAQDLYRSLKDVRNTWVFPGLDYLDIDQVQFIQPSIDDPDDTLEPTEVIEETYVKDEDNVWRISEPIEAYASQRKLGEMMNGLLLLQGDGYRDAPELLENYGFSVTSTKIVIRDSKHGVSHTLQLGWLDDMADDGRIFAKLDGNPAVFTIDAAILSKIPAMPGDFRERHLFRPRKTQNLRSIRYKDTKSEFVLTLDDALGWTLSDPAFDDTHQEMVNAYISILIGLKGSEFVDPEIMTELDKERIALTFEFKDGSPSTSIAFGGLVPDSDPPILYAQQDLGAVVTVPFYVYRFIKATPYTFRNKKLMSFEEIAVTQFSLQLEGISYTLKRDLGIWSVVEPKGYQVESQSDIDALLKTFVGYFALNEADPVPSSDITGVDAPILELSVEVVTPNGTETKGPLRVGNLISAKGRNRYSWIEGRDETFYVDHGFIEDIRRGVQGIRPAP